MRKYVKRGSISSKVQYEKLRNLVWEEVDKLDRENVVIHESTIQDIAMEKAEKLGLENFKVFNVKSNKISFLG